MSCLILAPGEVILDTLIAEKCTLEIITNPQLHFQLPTTDLSTFQVFSFFSQDIHQYTHVKVIVTTARIVVCPKGGDFLITRSFSLPLRFVDFCKVDEASACKVQFPLGKDTAQLSLFSAEANELATLISTTVVCIGVSRHLPGLQSESHSESDPESHSHHKLFTGSQLFYKQKAAPHYATVSETLPTYEQTEWALIAFQDGLELFKEISVEPYVEKHAVSMTLCMRRRASMKCKIGNSLYKSAYAQGANLAIRTWKEKGSQIRKLWAEKKSTPIIFKNYQEFRAFTTL